MQMSLQFWLSRILKSDGCEYQDLQSENRISNAYIHCGRIANPPERVAFAAVKPFRRICRLSGVTAGL
jgi:hypothetical protein